MTDTKNTVSDELLPCPFCVGEAKVKYVYNTSSICCADCCSSTAFFRDTDTAISVWNRRAASIPGGVGVKGLDDEDLASDERWNAGVNYAIERLCEVFGIDPKTINWDAATETLEGDVMSVICGVLTTAYGEEWSSDEQTARRIISALNLSPAEEEIGR